MQGSGFHSPRRSSWVQWAPESNTLEWIIRVICLTIQYWFLALTEWLPWLCAVEFATLAPLQSEWSLMNVHCIVTHIVPLSEGAFHTCVPLGSTDRIQEQSLLSNNSPLPYLNSRAGIRKPGTTVSKTWTLALLFQFVTDQINLFF